MSPRAPALSITPFPVTVFQQNCSLLRCARTGRGALVDPGGDPERILAAVRTQAIEVERVLLTHAHCDHAGAAAEIAERLRVPIEGPHRDDLFWIEALPAQAARFGLGAARSFVPARWLAQGDRVRVGESELEVRHCPGHTPGHVVFVDHAELRVVVGDVLFQGSIGRTDFPRGDHATLIASIERELLSLDDDVVVFPGHGPTTTIGRERRENPFLAPPRRHGRP